MNYFLNENPCDKCEGIFSSFLRWRRVQVYVNSSSSSSKDSMVWRQTKNIYFPTQFPPSYVYIFRYTSPCSVIKCVMYMSTVSKWEMPSSQALAIRLTRLLLLFFFGMLKRKIVNLIFLNSHLTFLALCSL